MNVIINTNAVSLIFLNRLHVTNVYDQSASLNDCLPNTLHDYAIRNSINCLIFFSIFDVDETVLRTDISNFLHREQVSTNTFRFLKIVYRNFFSDFFQSAFFDWYYAIPCTCKRIIFSVNEIWRKIILEQVSVY